MNPNKEQAISEIRKRQEPLNPLQQQLEALLPESIKPNEVGFLSSSNLGQNRMREKCKQSLPKIIELIEKNTREKCAKIVRSHLLTDWSGESEVEAQIEEIACKIDNYQLIKSLSQTTGE